MYRAVDQRTGEVVAAKMIDSAAVRASPKVFNNLQREITAMERVGGHPHVIGIKQVDFDALKPCKRRAGVVHDCVMIIMPLATGGEFFDYLMLARFEERVARTYFRQLLEALHHCHRSGVAHRDLKPENLLMDSEYALRVADWGLSAVVDDLDAAQLRTQCGTRAYMAPEVLRRAGYRGEPADVWSAGVVLFIMLAGFPPFEVASAGDWWYDRCAEGRHAMFWAAHERTVPFPAGAKDLINAIFVAGDRRITVEAALKHPWMMGDTLTPTELYATMRERRVAILRSKGRAVDEAGPLTLATVPGSGTTTMGATMMGGCGTTSDVSMTSGSDMFAESTVRSADYLPSRNPAFAPRAPAGAARVTAPVAVMDLPASLDVPAGVVAEPLPADLPSSTRLTWFCLRDTLPLPAIVTALAGCTESVCRGTAALKAPDAAKLKCSVPAVGGPVRFDAKVYTVPEARRGTRTDIPLDAAYLVDFQRTAGDALSFNVIYGTFSAAFGAYVAGSDAPAELPDAPVAVAAVAACGGAAAAAAAATAALPASAAALSIDGTISDSMPLL